jgi:integrase
MRSSRFGAEGLHVHDLRHTGNTFAASGGAGIKDLMARMGHNSERAAMIYQNPRVLHQTGAFALVA